MSVHERVISSEMLHKINAAIDKERDDWWPADGRHESEAAKSLCDLLREAGTFRRAEAIARAACERWTDRKFGRPAPEAAIHTIRCANRDTPSASYLIHLDRHLLTVLIPLQSAQGGDRNGDLIMYRQHEGTPSRAHQFAYRVMLFIQQNLPLALRRGMIERDLHRGRCVRIPVRPGNLYCFNGMITPHANLAVEDGERRSLLVHYYEPFPIAAPRGLIRRWRDLRARLSGES